MSPYNFGASWSILTKLFPRDVPRGRGDKMGITFGRPTLWNLGGQKTVQNLARFLTTFDFDREYLRKESTYRKSEKNLFNHNPFHVGRKKTWWTLVHKQHRSSGAYWRTQMVFSGGYISALKGCCPFKFLHVLEIDPGYLAHPHRGQWSPQNILMAKI